MCVYLCVFLFGNVSFIIIRLHYMGSDWKEYAHVNCSVKLEKIIESGIFLTKIFEYTKQSYIYNYTLV